MNGHIGKHKSLPTDKVVLVSKSGFTKGAKKTAEADGFEIVTLEEAEAVNWTSYFNQLQDLMLAAWNLQPISWGVRYERHESDKTEVAFGPNPKMYQEQKKKRYRQT